MVIIILIVALFLYVYEIKQSNILLKYEISGLNKNILSKSDKQAVYLKILILKPDMDKTQARNIANAIYKKSKEFRRDPDLILAIAKVESDLNPNVVSNMGAEGLLQVMPQWVEVFKNRCDLKEIECNLENGLRLLESYEQLYGNLEIALTVYNRGPTTVDWALIKGRNPDNGYAPKIMKTYEKLKDLR